MSEEIQYVYGWGEAMDDAVEDAIKHIDMSQIEIINTTSASRSDECVEVVIFYKDKKHNEKDE